MSGLIVELDLRKHPHFAKGYKNRPNKKDSFKRWIKKYDNIHILINMDSEPIKVIDLSTSEF